ELREAREIAGVGSQLRDGTLTDARKKVDPGLTGDKVVATLGKPSFSVATEGRDSRHEIWTYYYNDGTLTINLTDGAVARASALYEPRASPRRAADFDGRARGPGRPRT